MQKLFDYAIGFILFCVPGILEALRPAWPIVAVIACGWLFLELLGSHLTFRF